jgi:hypothetical protein
MTRDGAPATLPTLGKRQHVRVLIPATVHVYARVRSAAGVLGTVRGVVTDISAGGVAMHVTEGGRFDPPPPGSEAEVVIEHEGEEATVAGRVVRLAPRDVSFAFAPVARNEDVNLELLSLIGSVVTRRVELVDRRSAGRSLASKLTHRHFYGAGYLDLRVQTEAPGWWQVVFLEYLVAWSGRDGALVTGTIDRSFSAERAGDPLAVRPSVTRHAEPWPKLRKLAAGLAQKCSMALPEHTDAFRMIRRTVG